MNTEILKKLIAELRNPEYKQIKGDYWDGANGWCAGGLLNKVLDIPLEKFDYPRPDGRVYKPVKYKFIAILPYFEMGCKIVTMNDVENKSFTEIADWIEQTWLTTKQ